MGLLDAQDPRATYQKPGSKEPFLKEMVRIHHTRNCLLCHPPSLDASDAPRASLPLSDKEYYGNRGPFVRADVSYLKQDFSVTFPGEKRDSPPSRYDFVVRERVALYNDILTRQTSIQRRPCEQREAVLFALRHLTGRDAGTRSAQWKEMMRSEENTRR